MSATPETGPNNRPKASRSTPAPSPQVRATVSRNFALGVLNGSLFEVAMAFLGLSTIMPVFLSRITPASWVIGFANTIPQAGWFIPQLFLARLWENRPYKLPLYRIGAAIRITMMLCMVLSVLFLAQAHSSLTLFAFLAFLTLYGIGSGFSGLPFMEVVAKTIPPEKRASFFSMRFFLGGVGAFIAGLLIKVILSRPDILPYPYNYTLVFGVAWVFLTLGMGSFLLVDEPADNAISQQEVPPLRTYFANAVSVLRADEHYLRYLKLKVFLAGNGLAFPFYVNHALQVLGAAEAAVGILVSAEILGAILSNFVWGYAGDKHGPLSVLRLVAALGFFIPVLALLCSLLAPGLPSLLGLGAYCTLFFMRGALMKGAGVGQMSYILDLAPPEKRSTYIGFTNTFSAALSLMPLLGGFIVDLASYHTVYVVTAVMLAEAYLVTGDLREPRVVRKVSTIDVT